MPPYSSYFPEKPDSAMLAEEAWDRESDASQRQHGEFLSSDPEFCWGVWQIPDSQVGVFGRSSGIPLRVVELGCGAGQAILKLALQGFEVIGADISTRQLDAAARAFSEHGIHGELVHCSAHALPLEDSTVDIAFSDHGAATYFNPIAVINEAARVLRPGGLLVINTPTPWVVCCWDHATKRIQTHLVHDYFGTRALNFENAGRGLEKDEIAEFQLTYEEWISAFVNVELEVARLIELKPPPGTESTYSSFVGPEWASRFPSENLWITRKRTNSSGSTLPSAPSNTRLAGG